MRINEVAYGKMKTSLKVNGNLKHCASSFVPYVACESHDRAANYRLVVHKSLISTSDIRE